MRMRIFVPVACVAAVVAVDAAVALVPSAAPHVANPSVAATATAKAAGRTRLIVRFVPFASGRPVMTGSPSP
jgi:hypothetical protein